MLIDDVLDVADLGAEEGVDELLLGEVGELVDAHLVGLVVPGVVSVNLGDVLGEDPFPVLLLEHAVESKAEGGLVLLESHSFLVVVDTVQQKGGNTGNSQQDSDVLH